MEVRVLKLPAYLYYDKKDNPIFKISSKKNIKRPVFQLRFVEKD